MTFLLLAAETLVAPFAALGVIVAFLLSPRRGRLSGLGDELPERFGALAPEGRARLAGREVWWLHAASAGEVNGLIPFIEQLARRKNAPAILLTTTTRSGREAAKAVPSVSWAQLAPLDCWPCLARFLSHFTPSRLVITETELWPSMIVMAGSRGLQPSLINGRLTPRSFNRYRFMAPFVSSVLRSLSVVAVQTEEDAERFRRLGAPADTVRVTGSTKYDRESAPASVDAARARTEHLAWKDSPLFVAGSTHPYEEEMVLAAYMAARRSSPKLKLVLAPRHLERAADAKDLLEHAGLKVARWSAGTSSAPGADALLLDEMGVLASFYGLARASFVGGTLVPVGGHNLLEPALAGSPVLFGPHVGHIERPAALLAAPGAGGRRAADAGELAERLIELAGDPAAAKAAGDAARATASSLKGATARTLSALEGPDD